MGKTRRFFLEWPGKDVAGSELPIEAVKAIINNPGCVTYVFQNYELEGKDLILVSKEGEKTRC